MHFLYIVGEFPSKTEYFIANEIDEFGRVGVNVDIISLSQGNPDRKYCVYYEDKVKAWLTFFFKCITKPRLVVTLYRKLSLISSRDFLRKCKDIRTALFFSEELDMGHFDRIHSHFANRPTDIGYLLAVIHQKRFGFTAHAQDIYCANPTKLAYKIQFADLVITCTKYNFDYLTGLSRDEIHRKKLHLIFHGIYIEKWTFNMTTSIFTDRLRLLTICRLVPKKGVKYLLNAMIKIKQMYPNVHLNIIGEGPERDSLFAFCKLHDLSTVVTFLDFLPQPMLKAHYEESNIFILPSIIDVNNDRDGLPNVLLEAMASGVAVISTSISAIPSLVINRITGLLIPPEDSDAIVEAIRYVVENEGEVLAMKQNARDLISNFDINNSTMELLQLMR